MWSPLARGWLSCGRRSTQSLLEELLRAWSPLACGWLRCWEGQYTEPPGGAAARVVAAGPRLGCRVAHAVHRASWRKCGLPLTPSLTHHFVTHHLSHTTLSHTIFDTPLCHTPSFTHHFVTHHLSHTTLSHTTLSHTVFHTQLCHTPSFTHIIFHTHNFVTLRRPRPPRLRASRALCALDSGKAGSCRS